MKYIVYLLCLPGESVENKIWTKKWKKITGVKYIVLLAGLAYSLYQAAYEQVMYHLCIPHGCPELFADMYCRAIHAVVGMYSLYNFVIDSTLIMLINGCMYLLILHCEHFSIDESIISGSV